MIDLQSITCPTIANNIARVQYDWGDSTQVAFGNSVTVDRCCRRSCRQCFEYRLPLCLPHSISNVCVRVASVQRHCRGITIVYSISATATILCCRRQFCCCVQHCFDTCNNQMQPANTTWSISNSCLYPTVCICQCFS